MAQPNAGMSGSVKNPKTPQQAAAQMRLQHTNAQVDEVVGKMRNNVDDLLQRDGKLSDLLYRADVLEDGASQFGQNAKALKRKGCIKNVKITVVVVGVVGFLCLLVIGSKFSLFD